MGRGVLSVIISLASAGIVTLVRVVIDWGSLELLPLLATFGTATAAIIATGAVARIATYGQRIREDQKLLNQIETMVQSESERTARRIDERMERKAKLDNQELDQIHREIVRMGGRRLPVLLSGRITGGAGITGSATLEVIHSKNKWRTIKRNTKRCWNWVRTRLE